MHDKNEQMLKLLFLHAVRIAIKDGVKPQEFLDIGIGGNKEMVEFIDAMNKIMEDSLVGKPIVSPFNISKNG